MDIFLIALGLFIFGVALFLYALEVLNGTEKQHNEQVRQARYDEINFEYNGSPNDEHETLYRRM